MCGIILFNSSYSHYVIYYFLLLERLSLGRTYEVLAFSAAKHCLPCGNPCLSSVKLREMLSEGRHFSAYVASAATPLRKCWVNEANHQTLQTFRPSNNLLCLAIFWKKIRYKAPQNHILSLSLCFLYIFL